MTKLQRARELQAAALDCAAQSREYEAFWRGRSDGSIHSRCRVEENAANAGLSELEAEMYGDLIRSYELLEKETI